MELLTAVVFLLLILPFVFKAGRLLGWYSSELLVRLTKLND